MHAAPAHDASTTTLHQQQNIVVGTSGSGGAPPRPPPTQGAGTGALVSCGTAHTLVGAGAVGQAATVGQPCALKRVVTKDSVSKYSTQAATLQAPAAHAPLQARSPPKTAASFAQNRSLTPDL